MAHAATGIKTVHKAVVVISHGDFSEVHMKLFTFILQNFRKREVSFLVILGQKGGSKLETLVWRVVARYWRTLEEFRIQSILPVD